VSVLAYKISKEFHFSASHQLHHLAERDPDHQCARLHGHNYVVVVELAAADLDADGFVLDFGELHEVKRYIDQHLDHRHLNDVLDSPTGHLTTAEAMARLLHNRFKPLYPQLVAVRVSETPKTWSEYRP